MHPIQSILSGRVPGQKGVYSVCTASPLVLKAAIRHAGRHGYVLVIEATSNQVNQFGGYTGMQPADYAALVNGIMAEEGLSPERVILGGDHLGPLTWQNLPEDQAMANSEDLVTAYTLAGFTKIHLDTSMRVATDDPDAPLDVRVCAKRGARLAACVGRAYQTRLASCPGALKPVLIVGSEVPIPGGSQVHEDFVAPTEPAEFRRQYSIFKEEFEAAGLDFDQVAAFVVQPGVEFGDDFVCQYNRENAASLVAALADVKPLVFEGHSTDYQTKESLVRMVEDGIRILKVGPALTFGMREALFLAEEIEKTVISDESMRSHFKEVLLKEMNASDIYWKKYYTGTLEEIEYKKLYSYSDRCRYYFPAEPIREASDRLLSNLAGIPVALISQYFPCQYAKVVAGELPGDGESVILDRIGDWCSVYAAACGVKLN